METEALENVENGICTVAFIYIFDVLSWTTDEHGSIGILFQWERSSVDNWDKKESATMGENSLLHLVWDKKDKFENA